MSSTLLLELERELEYTEFLLRLAASQKKEDGTRTPTTKTKRKKQKLTPEQKKKQKLEQKLVKKVKDKLKDRKYKSKLTGKELSFNTALNRSHPKAKADFNKAMEKARGDSGGKVKVEVKYSDASQLSDEQLDLLERISVGMTDPKNMSLVEERTLGEALSILTGLHARLEDEGLEPEEEEPPKTRKTRSDKGKKRGPYKKRVKKELEAELSDEVKEQVDVDELTDLPIEQVKQTDKTLKSRAKDREAQTGEKEPKPTKEKPTKEKPTEKSKKLKDLPPTSPIEGVPLFSQPLYVQKDLIKDELEKAMKRQLDPEDQKIKELEEKLNSGSLSEAQKKQTQEEIKELKRKQKEENLVSTERRTKTVRKQIEAAVDAMEDITENQLKALVTSYESLSNEVSDILSNQGMKGLREWMKETAENTSSPNPPPSQDELLKQLDREVALVYELEQELGELNNRKEKLSAVLEEVKKLKGEDLSSRLEEIKDELINADILDSTNVEFESIYDVMDILKELEEKVSEKSTALSASQQKEKSLKKDYEDYESLQEKYALELGNYLAVQNAHEGIVKDPEFGLEDYPIDQGEVEKAEHERLVRKAQGEKFRGMEEEERSEQVKIISDRLKELRGKLQEEGLSEEEANKIQGQLQNVLTTEQALNTVRMINGEGVIDGYFEVSDDILEAARQSESDAWDDAIADLSTYGSTPSATRDHMRNVMDNLDHESFSAAMGGRGGDYSDILDTMKEDYCPATPTNSAAGVGDKELEPGETCPNAMPDDVRQMLREYMTDSFVNTRTISREMSYGRGRTKSDNKIDKKLQNEARYFWKERKDKFFMHFVDGVDERGDELSDEQKIAFAEQFRIEWFESDLKHALRSGVRLYDGSNRKYQFDQVMEEIKKAREIKGGSERSQRLQYLRQKLQGLFDEAVADQPEGQGRTANIFHKPFIDQRYMSGGSKIMQKRSTQYVDYQERSRAFELGMRVYPFLGGNPARSGIVVAIFPAIGMVDVQFPHGAQRYPVEDLVVDTSGDYKNLTNEESSVPGGLGVVPVSSRAVKKTASKVASRYVKQAIYWYKKDRTYRQCKDEIKPTCPKCKTPLGKTVYKRREGQSEKLLACYTCLFIIKPSDIIGG